MLLQGSSFLVVLSVHFSYSKGLFPAFSRAFSYFVVLFVLAVLFENLWYVSGPLATDLISLAIANRFKVSRVSPHYCGCLFFFPAFFYLGLLVWFLWSCATAFSLALCTIPFSSGCVLLRVFSLAFFYPAPLFSANVSLIVRDKVNCEGQSHKTMCTDHNFWRERRAEADLNRGPSAYQHNALPLAQTSSFTLSFLCSFKYWPCCQTSKPGFVIGKLTPSQQAHKTGV